MKHEKILILYSSYGSGHQQAANAIVDKLRAAEPEKEVVLFDFMKWAHPRTHVFSRSLFLHGIKTFPSAYGYLYRKTRGDNFMSWSLKQFNRFGLKRLQRHVQEINPSMIISTFPGAAGAMSALKSNGLLHVPTVTVITDHTDHSYWVYPNTDKYLVGSEQVRQGLLHHHRIPVWQIEVTGIPVRSLFLQTYKRSELAAKHGLDAKHPTFMFMGGGCGLFADGIEDLLSLETGSMPIQLIVVCGNNEKLRQRLSERLHLSKHRVLLTGFVNYVHELMAVSDMIITKPGGISTSEAIAMELPMLLHHSLPGQEVDNTVYLQQMGVSLKAGSMDELCHAIHKVLRQPELLQEMKENMRAIKKDWASYNVVDAILQTTLWDEWEREVDLASAFLY